MAGPNDKFKPTADEGPSTEFEVSAPTGGMEQLAALYALNTQLGDRNTVGDTAVNMLDTLQSIGTLIKAPLPGETNTLQQAAANSQTLDEFRSPAYLAERQINALTQKPTSSFAAGAVQGIENVLNGDNLIADVGAQVPYLMMGPAARAMGVAAAERIPGVLGKVATGIAGTGEGATINRIAALSGGLEGAGGYAQTYQRAIEQGASEEDALAQAQQAGAFSAVLGAALGRATPGFELSPTGRLAGNLVSNASQVGGEIVEEGGLAIGQTVFDNVLAGKDPMDGVGEAFGEAVAISSVFAGGMRAPSVVLDTAGEIGRGVRQGLQTIADRAQTPERAATAAAAAAATQQAQVQPQEEVIQSTEPVDNTAPTQDEAEEMAVGPAPQPPTREEIAARINDPANYPEGEYPSDEERNQAIDSLWAELNPTDLVESSDRRHDASRRKAIDELSPEEKDLEIARLRDALDNPIDATTGLIRSDMVGDDANTPMERALNDAVVRSEQEDTHWVSFDIANLGGLNEAMNNVAADANVHYRALVDIAKGVLENEGLQVKGFRTGGDEFGMVVQGGAEVLETALDEINKQIAAYTQENDLDQIPNPKGKAPGLQLHVGSTQVVPGDSVDTIRNRADRALDASKKAKANVGRKQTEAPRKDARDAGSEEDRGARSDAGQEVRAAAEDAAPAARKAPVKKPRQLKLGLRKSRRKARAKSNSDAVETILVNAELEGKIENLDGADQAEMLARHEEHAETVAQATATLEKMTPAAVEQRVAQAEAGDEQAELVVEAIARTDISKLPDSVIEPAVRPVVQVIRDLKDTKVDNTAKDILESGFSGRKNSRGVQGYLQDIINFAQNKGDSPNEAAQNLARFVAHLQARAALFEAALAKPGEHIKVEGTQTLDSNGKVKKDPFIIHKGNANSMAVVNRVLADAAQAQQALDKAKRSFPGMFPVERKKVAPVARTSPTPPAAPAAAARTAPVAPTAPSVAETKVETKVESKPAKKPKVKKVVNPVAEEKPALAAVVEEEQIETPPVVQATSTTPETTTANPLLADTLNWVDPTITTIYEVDPTHTMSGQLASLNAADRARLRQGAFGSTPEQASTIMKQLDRLLNEGIQKMLANNSIETLLKAPWAPWSHLLVKEGNGYVFPLAVRQAFATAAALHVYRAPTKYKASDIIDEEGNAVLDNDGHIKRDATPQAWAREIARDAMLLLGVKPNWNESETLTQGAMLSLGLTAVQAIVADDNVDLVKVEVGGKPRNVLIPKGEVAKQALDNMGFVKNVVDALGGEHEWQASLEPPTNTPDKVDYSDTPISESQKAGLLNRQKVPHYLNPLLKAFIGKVGADGLKRLLTGATIRDNMPKLVKELLKAQQEEVDQEINAANHYDDQIGGNIETPLYWPYTVSVNGRTNSSLSPQQKKLIRDLFTSARTTLDLTDTNQLNALKMTIAQALGAKTDIQSAEDVLKDYEKLAAQWGEKAKQLVAALSTGEKVFPLLERAQPYSPRELSGILTLGQLLTHDMSTPFESYLSFEIDGKTNGAFNTEMLYGLAGYGVPGKNTETNLEQGGLHLKKPGTTWGEQYANLLAKYGSKDLYARVAKSAIPILQAKWNEWLNKGDPGERSWKQKAIARNRELLVLSGMMSEGDKPEFLRDAAKTASNPIVYGAGNKGIANQLKKDMKANIVSEWLRVDYELSKKPGDKALLLQKIKLEEWLNADEKQWDFAATAAAEALNEAYKIEKPVVSAVTSLMVKITALGYAIKKAQWDSQHAEALALEKRNAEMIAELGETNAKGKKRDKWALSRNEYRRINRNTLSMTFSTAANDVGVSLDDTENQDSAFRVSGLGTAFDARLDIPQTKEPGVRVLALLTQAAGDASMGNEFFQTLRMVTDVYDGLEFKANEFMAMGEAANAAVWKTAQHDALKDFITVVERVKGQIINLPVEIQNQILAAYNATQPSEATMLESFEQFAGEVAIAETNIRAAHQAQLEGLARLKADPHTMLQMGGGQGHTTEATQRDAVARPNHRVDWDADIATAFRVNDGRMDRTGIIALLDSVKWKNPIQRMVWKSLRKLLPAGVMVRLATNQAEWDAFGLSRAYGSVDATMQSDTGEVWLATSSPSVILHELMHTVFTNTLQQYFSNINNVPAELRSPINDLVQLLSRFKKLKGDSIQEIQGIVAGLEQAGNMAAAIDEMLTYTMTESKLLDQLSPGFFTRVITRAKQILGGLFGKDVPGTFLEEALKAFNSISSGLNGSSIEPTFEMRDHTNWLEARTAAAFAGIAKKVARGQTFNVKGVVSTSHLDQLLPHFNLSVDQQRLFKRVFLLMRMETRPPELEQFVSTVLPNHPQANLFNGAKDVVASVMALAAVEPTFKAQLESIWTQQAGTPSLADRLLDKALNAAELGNVDQMLSEALQAMAEDAEYNLSWLGTVAGRLDRLGNRWLEKVGDKALDASQNAPRGADTLLAGIHALTTESGATAFGKSLLQAVNEFTDQRWLQDLVAGVLGSQDDTNTVYRQVKAMKNMIAQTRSMFTIALPAQLKTLFPEDFAGWNDLFTHFGRLDASVLGTAAADMYGNDQARRRMITALESRVQNHWDAKNLGHYLVHGTIVRGSPHALLRNARAIADNLHGTKRRATDAQVADADQLATLYAIEFMAPSDRARIASMFREHPQAMNNLIGMLQKVNEEDAKQYKDEYRYTYWKGNLPLSADPRHSIVVAGAVKGAALEALGYKKADRYPRTPGDPANDLYYYTRTYAPPPVFSQGILATVQQTAMGINYTTAATITPEVNTMITSPRLVAWIQRNQGVNSTLSPVFNFEGDIVAYERLLDRNIVQKHTKSDNTLLHIAIGHKLGRITEERLANRFNQEAIRILVDQWKAGEQAGEQAQYESVNSSTDKQIARAWEVIPAATKRALEDAFGGPVMIRKDLIANTLGYHKAGVGDIFTGNASLSEHTRKIMYGVAQSIAGPSAPQILFAAESAIKEGVATAKDWIIVRSLSVAINNAMASMNLVLANGVPISELISSYREGLRDVRAYGRLQKEIIELTMKIAGTTGDEQKRLKTLQVAKLEAVKRLAIYPLIEAGELSDLPEGLEESPTHSYLGDFAGWLNNHLRKIHPKTPTVMANLAIAKDSEFHDALSKAIQAGDFLGRWAVYKHMVKSGKTPDAARDTVRDEFIDYSINPGRFRGALEDYGLVWWSQFTIRAQKVLLRRFRRNPFAFLATQASATATGTDGPMDMALTERGLDNSTGLDQVWNAWSAPIWSKLF